MRRRLLPPTPRLTPIGLLALLAALTACLFFGSAAGTPEPTVPPPTGEVTDTPQPTPLIRGSEVAGTSEPANPVPGSDVTDTPEPTAQPPGSEVADTPEPAAQPPGGEVADTPEPTAQPPGDGQGPVAACGRPYTGSSPWNAAIGPNPAYHPDSALLIGSLEGGLGSNPDSWTIPVYEVNGSTPPVAVRLSNSFRNVIDGGVLEYGEKGGLIYAPIPPGARASKGDDAQMVVLNVETGDEWGFYQAHERKDGWQATGAYRYNVNWSGVPPGGFAGRGGGSPYLAGLVRRCEIERGYIDHALVMGYDFPCRADVCQAQGYPYFVFPAIKSDGIGEHPYDMPEGARLQLDPAASEEELACWCGDSGACRVIVRAMQEYGVFVMERSGHPKIYVEDDVTANWGGVLTERTVSGIPYSAFYVLDWNQ